MRPAPTAKSASRTASSASGGTKTTSLRATRRKLLDVLEQCELGLRVGGDGDVHRRELRDVGDRVHGLQPLEHAEERTLLRAAVEAPQNVERVTGRVHRVRPREIGR